MNVYCAKYQKLPLAVKRYLLAEDFDGARLMAGERIDDIPLVSLSLVGPLDVTSREFDMPLPEPTEAK